MRALDRSHGALTSRANATVPGRTEELRDTVVRLLAEQQKLAAALAARDAEIARLKAEIRLARDHGSY
jgi:hypothetical protein